MKYENLSQLISEEKRFTNSLLEMARRTIHSKNEVVFGVHTNFELDKININDCLEGDNDKIKYLKSETGKGLQTPYNMYDLVWAHTHPVGSFHPSYNDLEVNTELSSYNQLKHWSRLELIKESNEELPKEYQGRKINPIGLIICPSNMFNFEGIVFQETGKGTMADYLGFVKGEKLNPLLFNDYVFKNLLSLDLAVKSMNDSEIYRVSPLIVKKGVIQIQSYDFEKFSFV